jgi:hypothetical protein
MMRLLEVIALGAYGITIILGAFFISITDYWNHMQKTLPNPESKVRQCFVNREKLFEMSGTTTAFARIEILVYFTFVLTLLFLMIRSRFQKSGIDNSEQFEDVYMSYLVNKMIQSMVFRGKKLNRKFKP